MKQWLLCLLLVPFALTSCQKKSVSPLLNVIPDNAVFVFAMDNKQLITKGGFDNLKDFKFYSEMIEFLDENENKELWLTVLNDNKKSGLNIDRAYCFMEMQNEEPLVVFVTAMKDQSLFEQNLLTIGNMPIDAIQDKLSYKMLDLYGRGSLVWNNNLFFAFFGDVEEINFDNYFNLPDSKALISQADFKDFAKRSGDIGLWMPMQTYFDLMEMAAGYQSMGMDMMMQMPVMKEMTAINMHIYLDFNNDEIKMEVGMAPKEKVDAFYEKYPIFKWNSDQNMLKDFPANSYLAFKLAVDLPQYLKIFKQTMSAMPAADNELESIEEMLDNPAVNTVINALGGDFIFSLYGFAEGFVPMPLLGLSFTVKSENDFKNLLAMLPEGMVLDQGDYYDLSVGFMAVSFACKNNRVFVTADEGSLKSFLKGGQTKNITANASIGKMIKTSPSLSYINLDINEYPKSIRDFLTNTVGIDREMLSTYGIFKDLSMGMNSKYNMQASLKFKSGKENSLKQLVRLIDNINN